MNLDLTYKVTNVSVGANTGCPPPQHFRPEVPHHGQAKAGELGSVIDPPSQIELVVLCIARHGTQDVWLSAQLSMV